MTASSKIYSIVLCGFFSTVSAQATTFYVSTSGNDSNSCATAQSSGSSAKLTIPAGVLCLAAADTLIIQDGTYTLSAQLKTIPAGTDANNPTIVKAENSRQATIKSTARGSMFEIDVNDDFITIDGLVFDCESRSKSYALRWDGDEVSDGPLNGTVNDVEAHHCTNDGTIRVQQYSDNFTITNSYLHDCGVETDAFGHCLYMSSSNATVTDNTFENAAHYGMQYWCDGCTNATNALINRNTFIANGNFNPSSQRKGGGLILGHINNADVYNNVFRDQDSGSIADIVLRWHTNSGNKLYNNTLVDGYRCIEIGTKSSTVTYQNNLCSGHAKRILDNGPSSTASHNIDSTDDPQFTDEAGDDYTLTASSPARDAGKDLSHIFTTDYTNSTIRPKGTAWDVGAYEFVEDTSTLAAPRNLRIASN